MTTLQPKKIFKEKKTVKEELLKALNNGITLNYSSLAKLVGISVHRVKKYCKNHNIDLSNYNADIAYTKKIKKEFEKVTQESKKKKIKVDISNNKIDIGTPKEVKAALDNKKK